MSFDLTTLDGLFHDFLNLKKIRRTGWQLRGIRDCESIADHAFGVALLTMLLADKVTSHRLDRAHALELAMVHELGECRVGDIPYTALKYWTQKAEAEQAAVSDMTAPLGEAGERYQELFAEFEGNASVEARFVRAIDKLEMLITASEYEHTGFRALGDFWDNGSTFAAFDEFPELAAYARTLKRRHEERMK
ncbi:MAG TPA: HD domain-containing protein [Candidatus Ozemobacteraceae bacterium]|nr:HD domain-containing protein [Candidatus Ozemobacteraceae bacterium]